MDGRRGDDASRGRGIGEGQSCDDGFAGETAAAILQSVLDYMPRAQLIVRSDGRILHANAAAASRFEHMPGIEIDNGALHFAGATGGELREAFQAAASGKGQAWPSCVLVQPPGEAKLVFTFLPLKGHQPAHVLVLVQELPLSTAVPQRLRALLNLTPAETEVAIGVADGATLREIAAGRGVAETTVKVQLKTLMRKLGCRRQAQVAVIVRSLLPIHGYY